MIFEPEGLKLNIEYFHEAENDKPCLLFLHGFTGSLNDWKSIYPGINQNFSSAAVDLIGHGKTASPEDIEFYSAGAIADQIRNVAHTFKRKVIPVGYSMGGRAALTFAVTFPELVEALILESTTPGIKEEKLREERVKRDYEIAKYIKNHTMEEFADFWMDMEIFNTQRRFSEEKRKQLRLSRMKNNPVGLANSLLGFGTGTMPPLYNQLKEVKCKNLLITGDLDTKFTDINSEIVNLFPYAQQNIIKNAGHNTHAEEPVKFIQALNKFLDFL